MLRLFRHGLVAIYVLATLLAQASHNHGPTDGGRHAEHEAGCADPRPHIAGHWSPDLSGDHDDCVACQFRANHQASLLSPFGFERLISSASTDVPVLLVPCHSVHGNSCRAPPERDSA